jgi:very-short-patch-repair endonuclease
MSLDYNPKLIPLAKTLRRTLTRHERRLWYEFLARHSVRFQRQKTIGEFIVDFYCHKAKLVVELDGGQHYHDDGIVHDEKRTAALRAIGLCVIRFSNREIDENFPGVCQEIFRVVEERVGILSNP